MSLGDDSIYCWQLKRGLFSMGEVSYHVEIDQEATI